MRDFIRENFKIFMLVAILLVGNAGWVGWQVRAIYIKKAQEQDQVTGSMHQWIQAVDSLTATRNEWSGYFISIKTIQDIRSLYTNLRLDEYGLRSDPDRLIVTKSEAVVHNGRPLQILRVCLGSTGGSFDVSADSYPLLLRGATELLKRKDVAVEGLKIKKTSPADVKGPKGPTLTLENFCMFVRND